MWDILFCPSSYKLSIKVTALTFWIPIFLPSFIIFKYFFLNAFNGLRAISFALALFLYHPPGAALGQVLQKKPADLDFFAV